MTKRYLPKEFVAEDILNHKWHIFGMGVGGMVLGSFYGLTHSPRSQDIATFLRNSNLPSYLGPVLILEDYVKVWWYYIVIYLRLEAILHPVSVYLKNGQEATRVIMIFALPYPFHDDHAG